MLPGAVALALSEQIVGVDSVPVGEHDWKMDMIVTPEEVITKDSIDPRK